MNSPENPVNFLPMVEKLSWRISSRCGSTKTQLRSELYSVGSLALVEACEKYQEFEAEHFQKALYLRVRGAMIDFVKRPDFRRRHAMTPCFSEPEREEQLHGISHPKLPDEEIDKKRALTLLAEAAKELEGAERKMLQALIEGRALKEAFPSLSYSCCSKRKTKLLKKLRRSLCTQFRTDELLAA